jgi:hypothetical protein
MPGESVVEMVWGERCGVILRVGVQFSWSKKPCIPPSLAVHVFGWRIVHHRVMVCVMCVHLHVSVCSEVLGLPSP